MRPRRAVDHAGPGFRGPLSVAQRRADPRPARPHADPRTGTERRRSGRAGAAPDAAPADRALDRQDLGPGVPRPPARDRGALALQVGALVDIAQHAGIVDLVERDPVRVRLEYLARPGVAAQR